ncbi:MAG: FAD-dependent oxidoreductase, partial [Deltaproteobacteria bacterium]|nr:FAD-dependent oxidoreductase [Deltaproteobacteria bacterium]
MPYFIGRVVDDKKALIEGKPADFRKKYGLDIREHHEVTGIDTDKCLIEIHDIKAKRTFTEEYDRMMFAAGAIPVVPDMEGIDSRGIFGVNTLQSGLDLFKYVEKRKPEKAVVIGGGYIGLEMAENLLKRGMEVSLIERSSEVMGTLDEDMGRLVSRALEKAGVRLYRNESLEG